MEFHEIFHLGIVVRNLEQAKKYMKQRWGMVHLKWEMKIFSKIK